MQRLTRPLAAAALAGLLSVTMATPAGAAAKTIVKITKKTVGSTTISMAGKLIVGANALQPITVTSDPQGDAPIPNAGLDFGTVKVTPDLAGSKLTYSIQVHDMLPTGDTAPFSGYTLPFQVDGNDSNVYFLAAGEAGAGFPPSTGKFWALCTDISGYACSVPLSGTMDTSGITIELPFANAGIARGSIVAPGAALGCPGVCSNLWAVAVGGVLSMDTGTADPYRVPGSVQLGIAPAKTPAGQVPLTATATVGSTGAWTGSLPKPSSHGSFRLVAASCWGLTTKLTCALKSVLITL